MVLDERVHQRRRNFDAYYEGLNDLSGVAFPAEPDNAYANRWLTTVLIDPEKSGTNRVEVAAALEKENIESRPLWKPMHLQPVFQSAPAYSRGVSEKLFDTGLCLPSGSNLAEHDRDRVIRLFRGCWK